MCPFARGWLRHLRLVSGVFFLLAWVPPVAGEEAVFELREGDLLVRYTSSVLSRASVAFSQDDRRYSHVGLLWKDEDGQWHVVHALSRRRGEPGVFSEPLESFLEPAIRRGLFRWRFPADESRLLADVAAAWARSGDIAFDWSFDLSNAGAFYCTELIWRAALNVWDIDVVPQKSTWRDQVIISIEDLLRSTHLEEILHLAF